MRLRLTVSIALLIAASVEGLLAAEGPALSGKVDAWVLDTAARRDTEFLVMLREQADLRGAAAIARKEQKGAFVLDALRSRAEATPVSYTHLRAHETPEH